MEEHSTILLQDFIQHVRKFKFQIKKWINKKQSYINWVAHGGKVVYTLLAKDSFVQLLFVILRKWNN